MPKIHHSHPEIVKRLKRVQGHLRSVVSMIEEGRPCLEIAQQLHAVEKLVRLIGTPKCPTLIDVRVQDEFDADPHLIPSSRHCTFEKLDVWSEIPDSHP